VAAAVTEMAPRLGGIVHNASAFARTPEDTDAALADFERYWAVHMRAPWLLNRLLAPHLDGTAEHPADIVHITDIYADNPAPDFDIYCATKAGLQNLALSAAKRLAPAVKVNVIQPGPIDFTEWHGAAERQAILAATPLGRLGGPEAVYRALRGILDNDYLTGAVIPVDGGRRLAI
jgi:dihydromonapterin reductase/dihydrofolate reductase